MKRKFLVLLIVMSMILCCINVSAANLVLSGNVDESVKYVTVLMTQKGANLQKLNEKEIVWIEQSDVVNGSFAIGLPNIDTEYDLYSNIANPDLSGELTIYMSSNGDDSNDGLSPDKPIKTFAALSTRIDYVKEIVILDSAAYGGIGQDFKGEVLIRGLTGTETLTLYSIDSDVKVDNIKLTEASIYANGHKLEIGEKVISTGRLNVYGGAYGADCENTDIRLYGGTYKGIYGGCNGGGKVTGNTNVIIGGNVNPDDSINDDSSDFSPTVVYGGCVNEPVYGSTNVTLEGNATVGYIFGAGIGNGATTPKTNINIKGGKVMNVYAGAQNVTLDGTDTHITMTGGTAEALFGGSEAAPMTGNTYLTLKGGQVTRRVYTGCYNSYGFGWSSDRYVKGTTTLTIYPEMRLNTKEGLSSDNSENVGVFSGSRTKSSHNDEINTIIYMNGCYSTQSGKIGDKSGWESQLKSFANYSVNAGTGGEVLATGIGGQIKLIPDPGKAAVVNGIRYLGNQTAPLSTSLTEVKFEGITSATAEANNTGVVTNVKMNGSVSGKLFAVVYNENGSVVSVEIIDFKAGDNTYTVDIDCMLKSETSYIVKLFQWDGYSKLTPLAREYVIVL